MATVAEVRALLAGTSLPAGLVDDLLAGASALWLMGEPAAVVAADLALCHPCLAPEEVRAVVMPTDDPQVWRLTVAAHDRSGLVAACAGVLAGRGLSIVAASVTTWPEHGVAVQRISAHHPRGRVADWDAVGEDLRAALGRREMVSTAFTPSGPVEVVAHSETGDRTLVQVRAPDRVGLLWAVAQWMADHECNIEVARVSGADGMADDTFVVTGAVDACALVAHLLGDAPEDVPVRTGPVALPFVVLDRVVGTAGGLLRAGSIGLDSARRTLLRQR